MPHVRNRIFNCFLIILTINLLFISYIHLSNFSNLPDKKSIESNIGISGEIWKKSWGFSEYDHASSVALDNFDNIYLTGQCYNETSQNRDISTLKYNNAGKLEWAKTWGGSGREWNGYSIGRDILVDKSNEIYVGGYTDVVGNSLALLKYNSTGEEIWSKTFDFTGLNDSDDCIGITTDSYENIILGGFINTENKSQDFLILKLDKSGVPLWTHSWGGKEKDFPTSIGVDSKNNIYLAGYTESYGAEKRDIYLAKLDEDGNLLWDIKYGAALDDICLSLKIDSSDNIILGGESNSYTNGFFDMLLLKFNPQGTPLWSQIWGFSANDQFGDLIIDKEDNIYLTGRSDSLSSRTIYIVKFNKEGYEQGSYIWDSSFARFDVNAIIINSQNEFLIAGDSYNQYNYTSDVFLAKLPSNILFENRVDVRNKFIEQKYEKIHDNTIIFPISMIILFVLLIGILISSYFTYPYLKLKFKKVFNKKEELSSLEANIKEISSKYYGIKISEIAEETNFQLNQVKKTVQEMIKKKEIKATYYRSTDTVIFYSNDKIRKIDELMNLYDEWDTSNFKKKKDL